MYIMHLNHIHFPLPLPTDPLFSSQIVPFCAVFRVIYQNLGEGLLTGIWATYQWVHQGKKVCLPHQPWNPQGGAWHWELLPAPWQDWDRSCAGKQNCSEFKSATARSCPEDNIPQCSPFLSLLGNLSAPPSFVMFLESCKEFQRRPVQSWTFSTCGCFYRQARLGSWPQIQRRHIGFSLQLWEGATTCLDGSNCVREEGKEAGVSVISTDLISFRGRQTGGRREVMAYKKQCGNGKEAFCFRRGPSEGNKYMGHQTKGPTGGELS